MSRLVVMVLALPLSLLVAACKGGVDAPAQSSTSTPSSATKVAVLPPAEKPADALASTNTNFAGVVADVTEFRRSGSVLTALVRLRNQGTSIALVDIGFANTYVMDAGAKKYQVLKDEEDAFIASAAARVNEGIIQGGTLTLWMKFPAPAPEVRGATLVLPGMPPFENYPSKTNETTILRVCGSDCCLRRLVIDRRGSRLVRGSLGCGGGGCGREVRRSARTEACARDSRVCAHDSSARPGVKWKIETADGRTSGTP